MALAEKANGQAGAVDTDADTNGHGPAAGPKAKFSDAQLSQLHRVVRDVIREEIKTQRSWEQTTAPHRNGLPLVFARVAGSRCKIPDEPVEEQAALQVECASVASPLTASQALAGIEVVPPTPTNHIEGNGTASQQMYARKNSITSMLAEEDLDILSKYAHHSKMLQVARTGLFKFVHSKWFDGIMGLLIVANQVCIGVEVQLRIDEADYKWLFYVESLFLICFIMEALARLLADGWSNVSSTWFWFDMILVGTGALFTWIVEPILNEVDVTDVPLAPQVLILRALRLLRMVRAFRLVEQLRELWELCSGLLQSGKTILSAGALVLIAIFSFACLGVDLITYSTTLQAIPETEAIIERNFSNLGRFMLTLIQFANADSIASIYFPLCREQPLLVIYFMCMWLVITIALMNVVTAIIVENAMTKGREDAEEKKKEMRATLKKIVPQIEAVFDKIDKDGTGSVTLDEIDEVNRSDELVLPDCIKHFVEPDKLKDLLGSFDVDGSGEIDKEEFVEGVCWLVMSDVPIETTQILQLIRHTHAMLMEVKESLALRHP